MFCTESDTNYANYKESQDAFLFSLVNKDNTPPFKSDVKSAYSTWAIYTHPLYGPTFGYQKDICIAHNAGYSSNSYTNFGDTYALPNGYVKGASDTYSLLAGSYYFKPSEIEVFCVD